MKPGKYIGMDVHQATISVAVLDDGGNYRVKLQWSNTKSPEKVAERQRQEQCQLRVTL